MNNKILITERLCKDFGGIQAIQNLDFTISEGEIKVIIGPNGSGKTTFFNLIMNLYPPTSGSIKFGGGLIDLKNQPTHKINKFGIARTFQNLRLFGNMSVVENVLVGMHTTIKSGFLDAILKTKLQVKEEKEAFDKAIEILSFFGKRLISMLNQPAYSLSYANRRRLEIARALASEPKLVLLDEPVAGMNPTETTEVIEQLKMINGKGYSLIVIEHDMTLVGELAKNVVVLDHGIKIAEGSFAEVSKNPEVVKAYLGKTVQERMSASN